MKRPRFGTYLSVLLAGAVMGGLWWGFHERPVSVDMVQAIVAPMEVTIEQDGKTRVSDIYRVSAPITGRLERSLLKVGDPVIQGQTVVATIRPLPPAFMDERSLSEARAGVAQGQASVALAEAELARSLAALNLAEDGYQRAQRLATSQTIPQAQLDQARADLKLALAVVQSARAQVEVARAQLTSAQARLIQPGDNPDDTPETATCCVHVRAPIDGVVLSLAVESEQVVAAGAQIAQLGDPSRIEVVADLMSSDAVTIKPGTPARISAWGGTPLDAVVTRIDPAGFTSVSALGIEEQRVNTVLHLNDASQATGLGHDYHVRVALQVWQNDKVLQLPLTALFRDGSRWAVFALRKGRAVLVGVEVGQVNFDHAQILSGLGSGDLVINYPGDAVSDGVQVTAREPARGD